MPSGEGLDLSFRFHQSDMAMGATSLLLSVHTVLGYFQHIYQPNLVVMKGASHVLGCSRMDVEEARGMISLWL